VRAVEPVVEHALAKSFLARVPDAIVHRLIANAPIREIPAGRLFLKEADPHRCGMMITGLARVYVVRPNGAQVTLRRIGPGAAVGVRAMVGRRNLVNAQAITDCEVLRLDAEVLVSQGVKEAALGWAIALELGRRLEDVHLIIEGSLAGSVRQKIAGVLLDLTVEEGPLGVEMTQEELAEAVGASREAVGRELRWLDSEGLIQLKRGAISLTDPFSLQSIARNPSTRHKGTVKPASD